MQYKTKLGGEIVDVKVIDMPGFDRLDYRTGTLPASTLRILDGIIVTYNRLSDRSE